MAGKCPACGLKIDARPEDWEFVDGRMVDAHGADGRPLEIDLWPSLCRIAHEHYLRKGRTEKEAEDFGAKYAYAMYRDFGGRKWKDWAPCPEGEVNPIVRRMVGLRKQKAYAKRKMEERWGRRRGRMNEKDVDFMDRVLAEMLAMAIAEGSAEGRDAARAAEELAKAWAESRREWADEDPCGS